MSRRGHADCLPGAWLRSTRLSGNHAQFQSGSGDNIAAASAQRGTSLQALALLLFGVIVALAMLVIVAQSIARQAYATSGDFPVLRALGTSPRQLLAVALAPGALVAAGGMALAVPVAYGLSALTPIGLVRRAAITVLRVVRIRTGMPAAKTASRGSGLARWMAHRGFPPTAVSGVRLAF